MSAVDGEFSALCAALNAMPARFHLSDRPPAGSVSFAALRDPIVASGLIESVCAARGTTNRQIGASLLVQGIAMRAWLK